MLKEELISTKEKIANILNSVDVNALSLEIYEFLINNVETYVDTNTKQYNLDIMNFGTTEMTKLESAYKLIPEDSSVMSKFMEKTKGIIDIQTGFFDHDRYSKLSSGEMELFKSLNKVVIDDAHIDDEKSKKELLEKDNIDNADYVIEAECLDIVSSMYSLFEPIETGVVLALNSSKDERKEFFDKLIFYYELTSVSYYKQDDEVKELFNLKKKSGAVLFNYFCYDIFKMDLVVQHKDGHGVNDGEAEKITLEPGFAVSFDLSFKDLTPATLF